MAPRFVGVMGGGWAGCKKGEELNNTNSLSQNRPRRESAAQGTEPVTL